MSSQLKSILSALSQVTKQQPQQPQQQQQSSQQPTTTTGGGGFSSSNINNNSSSIRPSQSSLATGISSSLFNLKQLIGRSNTTTTRPLNNSNNNNQQLNNNNNNNQSCNNNNQPCDQPADDQPAKQQQTSSAGGPATLIRSIPNNTQQTRLPTPNPPPNGRPVNRISSQPQASPPISPPQQQAKWQQSQQSQQNPTAIHGQIPPKGQQQHPPIQQSPFQHQQFSKSSPSDFSSVVHSGQQQQQPMMASVSSQHSPPMASVPMAVVLGIVDSPMNQGAWELDAGDLQSLINAFGPTEWFRVLCSPLGSGRVPDCCIAKFREASSTRRIEAELDGIQLENVGKLVVNVVPSSMLDGVADEASLAALVSSKVQAKATTPVPGPSNQQIQPDEEMETIAVVLSEALRVGDAKALLATEAGRNAVAALKADPSLLGAIQSQLQALQTSSAILSTEAQRGVAASGLGLVPRANEAARKRVCRLELVDLFGHHPEFDVANLVVGHDNSNIQYVLEEASQKVDIDLDGVPYNGAPIAERLHLTVTALDEDAYSIAVETLEDLLSSICRQFVEFCGKNNLGPVPPTMGFKRHEYIEDSDGQLVYLGQKERPKRWLEQQQQQTVTTGRY